MLTIILQLLPAFSFFKHMPFIESDWLHWPASPRNPCVSGLLALGLKVYTPIVPVVFVEVLEF